jgi:hypothetical protein
LRAISETVRPIDSEEVACRGRRVAHVDDELVFQDHEVVDEAARAVAGLGPYAGAAFSEVLFPDFGNSAFARPW